MIRRMIERTAAAVLLIAGLVGCATEPAPQYPELTFSHLPPITLGVARIEVVNQAVRQDNLTHVEALMPVSPETAMATWARERLRANGVAGVAKFIIQNASVTEEQLPRTEGLKGAFTKDQSHRYRAKARAVIELEGVPRLSQAFAEADVTRTQTVREDASINDREQVWFELTEAVMRDFDPAMSQSIRAHLADFIR